MRVVVRNGVSIDLIRLLVEDLRTDLAALEALEAPIPKAGGPQSAFHH
jgi:hypothetical protein